MAAEPLVDSFLFDLKLADQAHHRCLTGVANGLIRRNLATFARHARS
jgi:pyruvate-formate lyase-activating enzyme